MDKLKKYIISFVIILAYLTLSIILDGVFINVYELKYAYIYRSIIIIVILFFVFKKDIIKNFKSFKLKYLSTGLKWWLTGYALMVLTNSILINIFKSISQNESANRQMLENIPIESIFMIIIFAPITEELIFRLNIKRLSNNKYHYAIMSGLLFGFFHVLSGDYLYIIPYGVLGYSFAMMHFETKNILTPIIFHAVHNVFAVALILFF